MPAKNLITPILYIYIYIYGDVGCETLSDIFGVAMQPYEAILRESGDLSINNLLILVITEIHLLKHIFCDFDQISLPLEVYIPNFMSK